jgi:AcrR family transcriptional regulator
MTEHVRARRNDQGVARVVAAARRCFSAKGVGQTRMDDIAAEAGMARQNLYRYVAGRDELVELAIIECTREFAANLRARIAPDIADLRAAIIDQIIASVMMGRDSKEFVHLTGALSRLRLNLLFGGTAVHNTVLASFDPLLKRARVADMLRTDVSEDEMIEWLQGILTFLAPRVDLDGEPLRRMIDKFAASTLLDAERDKTGWLTP